jgi:ATP-dependent Lhr-like helicase
MAPPGAEGRWALVAPVASNGHRSNRPARGPADSTKWAAAITQQLLARHGVLTREAVAAESIPGGFGVVYPVLKTMEETGRLRRGYFVAGLGATQFALPGALDLLRSLRDAPDDPEVAVLAATDPANPYGATLPWPKTLAADQGRGPIRTVGASAILVDGAIGAYLARGDRQLLLFLPEAEPQRSRVVRAVASALIDRARSGDEAPRGMLIEEIDGQPASLHPAAGVFVEAGFIRGALGLQPTFGVRHSAQIEDSQNSQRP